MLRTTIDELQPRLVIPSLPAAAAPAVSAAQMARVDRLAVGEFGISLFAMMEQAGAHLAEAARLLLGDNLRGRSLVVAVGPGNNGGGGLAAARHLANRGASVHVVLARPALRLSEAARHQLATLLAMRLTCCVNVYDLPSAELDAELDEADLVVDALLGYNVSGAPRGEVADLLRSLNRADRPILSLDLPSGLNPDTGEAPGDVIDATATLTLALPKTGLLTPAGRGRAGRLFLADLGLPAALYARLGLVVDAPFAAGSLVELVA